MPRRRSSRRQPCSTTWACGGSWRCSRPGSASLKIGSAPTSCAASSSKPPVEGLFDPLGVLEERPVVVPGRRGQRVLLRIAPAFPVTLDCRLDKFYPGGVLAVLGWGREGEKLPPAILARG